MSAFPADTNASAVILADYGEVRFRSSGNYVFERVRRVKLLSEAGYDWATVTIPYHAGRYGQELEEVKGQTITLGEDSTVQYYPLQDESIFEEDRGGALKQVRFTLPALEPGAIVEYRYKMMSETPFFLPDWNFQYAEPVLYSEYQIENPRWLQYARVTQGAPNFEVESTDPINRPTLQGTRYRWVMKDVPALREEPFMTTPEDYRMKMKFQLAGYSHPLLGKEEFLSSWDELAKDLTNGGGFGEELEGSGDIRRQVEQILDGGESPKEKMVALYDYVRTNFTWNNVRNVNARNLDEVLRSKKGDSADLTLLLVAMLNETGLEANPVLISTRSHGHVTRVYPLLTQFNDVLAAVNVNGKRHLLSPTDRLRPHDLLPTEALNGEGWLVREDNPMWIRVKAPGRHRRTTLLSARLDASGSLDGTFEVRDQDYSALERRHTLEEQDEEAFARDALLTGLDNAQISASEVQNTEQVTPPLKSEVSFSAPAYAQAASNYLYVNLFPVKLLGENPLHLPERTFPMDLTYPRDLKYTLNLQLPAGYEVEELPKNRRYRLPSGGAMFQRLTRVDGNRLTMLVRFQLTKSFYPPSVYKPLRNFFDEVMAAQAEQVVLKRTGQSASK